ncbi:MAG: MFS transporter [Moraxellaceae bacterium]|nr:MFS transporter [Moraxellaceae bacterium]
MNPPLPEARERALLILLMLVQLTVIVDFMIMMPLSSMLMGELDIDTTAFGLLVSAYSFAAGASSLLAASLADRFDRRSALLVTYVGLTIATLGCALAHGYTMMLVARAVAGLFGGVLGSITLSIVGDVIPPQRRGRAMGLVMLGFSLASVAGVPLGLIIANHMGWRAPFVVLAVLCAGVWIVAVRVVPHVRGHLSAAPTGFLASYGELLRERNHLWSLAMSAAVMFSGFLIIPYIAPSMVSNIGLTPSDLIWIYLAGGAATLVTRPWIGHQTDRHRHAHVLSLLAVASVLPINIVANTPQLGLPWQIGISVLFFVLVSGRFIPASALATGATRPALRGRLMAATSAAQNLASGSAAFIAGAMMSNGPRGELIGFPTVGLLATAGTVLAIWLAYRVRAVS